MRSKEQVLTFFLLIMTVVTTATVLGMRSQTQEDVKSARMTRQEKERAFPVVDFDEPEAVDKELREKRQTRSKRYDKYSGQKIEPSSKSYTRLWSSDWADHLASIPIAESDVVVNCTVTRAAAHMSNDKTAVYSEFECRVDEVFKSQRTPIAVGATLVLQRFGGIVRFPNGTTLTHETAGQGMPLAGFQYVFFLKEINETGDFRIVTGYELSGSHVTPLDGSIADEGTRRYPFDKYQGYQPALFLKVVKEAIESIGN